MLRDFDPLVLFSGRLTLERNSAQGRRAIARFHSDAEVTIEALLGRSVDLVTERGLKPRARRHVERDLVRVA